MGTTLVSSADIASPTPTFLTSSLSSLFDDFSISSIVVCGFASSLSTVGSAALSWYFPAGKLLISSTVLKLPAGGEAGGLLFFCSASSPLCVGFSSSGDGFCSEGRGGISLIVGFSSSMSLTLAGLVAVAGWESSLIFPVSFSSSGFFDGVSSSSGFGMVGGAAALASK